MIHRKSKGITIISLVITIIVLLILAGVSIATLTGENGIITQANNVKTKTELAEEKEQIKLAYASAMGDTKLKGVTPEKLQQELEKIGYKSTVTLERDEDGNQGILVKVNKKERYYFIQNNQIRTATEEEFSKEITPVYAILYSDGDLRFNQTGNIDETKIANGATVTFKSNNFSEKDYTYSDEIPWYSYRENIKSVTFEEKIVPKNIHLWFSECSNLEIINNIGKLKTNHAKSMQGMFYKCAKLTTLDLSTFDTSNIESMYHTFDGMTNLTSLDVSNFNTEKVENMSSVFLNCRSLKSLDLSSFNTKSATDMHKMFQEMYSLEKLNISNFNTEKVQRMDYMFTSCYNLKSLDLLRFNTISVSNMENMFYDMKTIKELDLSSFNTKNVTKMGAMFYGLNNLIELNLGDTFFTENVTNMRHMFDGVSNLSSLDISTFKTQNVEDMGYIFANMNKLEQLNISSFTSEKATKIEYMFFNCSNLKKLDMRLLNVSDEITYTDIFTNINKDVTVIVKDDENNSTKAWVQNKLGTGKGTVLTVSEFEN